jgi:hypothetical protein
MLKILKAGKLGGLEAKKTTQVSLPSSLLAFQPPGLPLT